MTSAISGEHAETLYMKLMHEQKGVLPSALPKRLRGRLKKIKEFFDAMATLEEKEQLQSDLEQGARHDIVRRLQNLVRARFAQRYRELNPRKEVRHRCLHASPLHSSKAWFCLCGTGRHQTQKLTFVTQVARFILQL